MYTRANRSPHQHRRPRTKRAIVAWILIGGFLLQPVLAYLVTPIVTHDVKGLRVVVCTLKGSKAVTIELPHPSDNQGAEHCSALKLYQMASTAQVSVPAVAPAVTLYAIHLIDQTADRSHRSLHFSAYATRAPPAVS
jgi:hypothetical protein